MKKYFISLFILFFAGMIPVSAMCTWGFVPPTRFYEPLDATEAFISHDDGRQSIVIVPEFKSSAEDFGIVYPTPSLPRVTEGPKNLFNDLNELTNPIQDVPVMMAAIAEDSVMRDTEAVVTVIERKLVGDFDVAVLKADTARVLTVWLEKNGYNFTKNDEGKLDFYVEKGGFYFVALKINTEEIDTDDDGNVVGELEPIQISFDTESPQLPMMSLASNMPIMTFDLYTLSSVPYMVPGVSTFYSQKIGEVDVGHAPSLEVYDPVGKWLIRQEIKFNPTKISDDLHLSQYDSLNQLIVKSSNMPKIFDPHMLKSKAGILKGNRGDIVYIGEGQVEPPLMCKVWYDGCNNCSRGDKDGLFACTLRACFQQDTPKCLEYFGTNPDPEVRSITFTRSLSVGSQGQDVLDLQKKLNSLGFIVSATGAGSPGNESTYFGSRTKAAVKAYQNANRSTILTPIGLSVGTGYFGPATIKVIQTQ